MPLKQVSLLTAQFLLITADHAATKQWSPSFEYDGTPPNPSTIDVMVGSPSETQTRVRDMLQSFGNLPGGGYSTMIWVGTCR